MQCGRRVEKMLQLKLIRFTTELQRKLRTNSIYFNTSLLVAKPCLAPFHLPKQEVTSTLKSRAAWGFVSVAPPETQPLKISQRVLYDTQAIPLPG